MLRDASSESRLPDATHPQHCHDPATVGGDPLLHQGAFLLAPIKISDIRHFTPILVGNCASDGFLLFVYPSHLRGCLAEDRADFLTLREVGKILSIFPSTNGFGVNPNLFRQLPLR